MDITKMYVCLFVHFVNVNKFYKSKNTSIFNLLSQISGRKLHLVGTFLHPPYIFEKSFLRTIILSINILITEKLLARILNLVFTHIFQNSCH